MISRHKILQPDEIALVLGKMREKQHTKNGQVDLIVFRLACCCGLRRGEIVALNIGDVIVAGPCPAITIRKQTTKGKGSYGQARTIPLDMDQGTLDDLREWHSARWEATGGQRNEPFVCGVSEGSVLYTRGKRLTEDLVARRWKTALKILKEERRRQLSIHKGRHTFISHSIHAGIPLAEVQEMAGHSQISSTNEYVHSLDQRRPRNVFGTPIPPASAPLSRARRRSRDSRT